MMLSGSVWRVIVSTCGPRSACQQQQKQPPSKVRCSSSPPPMIRLSVTLSLSASFSTSCVAFPLPSHLSLHLFLFPCLPSNMIPPPFFPQVSFSLAALSVVMPLSFLSWSYEFQRTEMLIVWLWGGEKKRNSFSWIKRRCKIWDVSEKTKTRCVLVSFPENVETTDKKMLHVVVFHMKAAQA